MSEKVVFNGDLGQAVMGDVKEAAQFSNVVNLSFNEVKKETPLITECQRERINVLVKEWAAICGETENEIYKVFITDYGLRYFRELPMEHYLTVKKTLEGRIAAGASKAIVPSPSIVIKGLGKQSGEQVYCVACSGIFFKFSNLQQTIFSQWVSILILTYCCGWLLYQLRSPHQTDLQMRENKCYFDGKIYSPGSMVRSIAGDLQECKAAALDASAKWEVSRRAR